MPSDELFLLSASGARARLVGACLGVLAGDAGLRVRRGILGDAALLLEADAPRAWLVLEPDSVAPEDVGLVRRFLARKGERRLFVVQEGAPGDPAAGGPCAGLPGTTRLPWPCDLELLGRQLEPPGEAEAPPPPAAAPPADPRPAAPGPPPAGASPPGLPPEEPPPAPAARPARREPRPPEPPGTVLPTRLDLKGLLEDLVTKAALEEPAAIRYRFEGPDELPLEGDAPALARLLGALLDAAREAAGPTGWVEIRVEPRPEGALVAWTFPEAGPAGGPGTEEHLAERLARLPLPAGASRPTLERPGPGRHVLRIELARRPALDPPASARG